jgi:hypothetical protein
MNREWVRLMPTEGPFATEKIEDEILLVKYPMFALRYATILQLVSR